MNVLVLGATSALIRETNRLLAEAGARFFLVGRHREKLAVTSADLRARGAGIAGSVAADLRHLEAHAVLIEEAWKALETIDLVLMAHGVLVDQTAAVADPAPAVEGALVNYTSAISLLTLVGRRMEFQGRGTIAVVSSVAGDRGRGSNYVYGSAKAGLDAFVSGLRNRLHAAGVAVVTLKPGLVATPMTAGLRVTPLFSDPRRAGAAIHAAIRARREVAYIPWWWGWIMLGIRLLPEAVFKRLKL